MFQLDVTPGRTAFVNNEEYLFFSGYAYLGMNDAPEFIQHIHKGMELYGAVFPSSRISNTQLNLYTQTENLLSTITNTADTVLMQSGFTAGKAAVETIAKGTVVFHAPFCHPAIKLGNNSVLSFADWAKETVDAINTNNYNQAPVILSDALNQLTAEVYDFSFLNAINKNIVCIIDDSHGMGLLGNNGEGISSRLPRKENIEYIITYSLSKALNIQAGAVSCTHKKTADKIRAGNWYATTTPPSPALLYAFCASQNIYAQQRNSLNKNKAFLQELFSNRNDIRFHAEIPVFIFPEQFDEDFFAKHGIIISSFAYPDPQGKKINRAVINALHTQDDLERLADAVNIG